MLLQFYVVMLMFISFVTPQLCTQHRKYISCDMWKKEIKHLSWYEDSITVDTTFPGIVDIEFSNCGIESIGSGAFEDYLNEIRYISLSNNKISKLEDNLFKNNVELEILKLNNNSISVIPSDVFESLINLKHLYLQDNKITNITTSPFNSLTNLTVLHLERNKIWQISPNTFHATHNLEYIDLRENPIQIPPRIYDLTASIKFLQSNPQFFKIGHTAPTVTATEPESDGMTKYIIGAVVGGIVAALLIIGVFFALRKRLLPKQKKREDTPYYDEIRNESIRTSDATSNSYIQPNFNPNLNQHLTARNFSYLEPKVISKPTTSKPFRRSDSYEKDIELPSMPERPRVQPNAYNTFHNSSFMNK